ncbi:unnamed protein product [Pieris macdunnoughi]|uniref:Uncharacterized protein n=1 Tax=Pieris macdunnoughi TaxID=345717 RepID=A0A821UL80_9NEOP|nr:unnamed protein product [Pieris macdunnoughi]
MGMLLSRVLGAQPTPDVSTNQATQFLPFNPDEPDCDIDGPMKRPYSRILRDETNLCFSRATITDWYSYCREVVVTYYLENQEVKGKIGGLGKIVQIGESKFGRRKYNKRRRVEGHWVLGMIEDGSEDKRLEVCPDNVRSAEVLVPLIKKSHSFMKLIEAINYIYKP